MYMTEKYFNTNTYVPFKKHGGGKEEQLVYVSANDVITVEEVSKNISEIHLKHGRSVCVKENPKTIVEKICAK